MELPKLCITMEGRRAGRAYVEYRHRNHARIMSSCCLAPLRVAVPSTKPKVKHRKRLYSSTRPSYQARRCIPNTGTVGLMPAEARNLGKREDLL